MWMWTQESLGIWFQWDPLALLVNPSVEAPACKLHLQFSVVKSQRNAFSAGVCQVHANAQCDGSLALVFYMYVLSILSFLGKVISQGSMKDSLL